MKKRFLFPAALLALLSTLNSQIFTLRAQGTAFTYQGLLTENGTPVTGIYEFRFRLYATETDLTELTTGRTNYGVPVTNGLVMTKMDFGDVFPGDVRWLDIGSRTNGNPADFTPLNPREELTPTPYAIYAASAGTATGVVASAVSAPQLNTASGPSPGQVLSYNGTDLVWITAGGSSSSDAWRLGGNGGTTSANFLGTTDNHPLELRVNNERALRLELSISGAPNVIGGAAGNFVASPRVGATIAGGGALHYGADPGDGNPGVNYTNSVTGDFGTVSGGAINTSSSYGTVGGGNFNRSLNLYATVGGGGVNSSTQPYATVGGGWGNTSSGNSATVSGGNGNTSSSDYATVGGGNRNTASDNWATVGGGQQNLAWRTGSTVAGGETNSAFGSYSSIAGGYNNYIGVNGTSATIPGGSGNSALGDGSFAAGRDAHANHVGSFVWGDGTGGAYSGGPNRFDVLATGGVGFFVPGGSVNISPDGTLSTKVLVINGADVAEPFVLSTKDLPKGSVVIIDDDNPGQLKLSDRAYDKRVAGILSGANGIRAGICLSQHGFNDGGQDVALSGRVYVMADAASGAITPGDLLTTSSTPGHAMRVADHAQAQGAILGKAMSSLKQGQGMVLVLVTLQ